jgi:predicted dehydrogenase/threonine dehydrogenase-like Zn-dependent dehydrogenase
MKQVVQNFRTGELKVEDLPPPALRPGGVLVRTAFSLISPGTERSIVETAQSSLLGKARQRPDLVRQVIDLFKREGLRSTYEKVKSRLGQVKALGYSASGTVIEVGEGVSEFQAGDLVACAGAGYASHAEVIFVPKNLACKLPEGASLESACYTTVGAIALQGIRQSETRLGETVAVVGLGLVGQLTVQMLKAAGCQVIGFDIDAAACELAKKSGADYVANDTAAVRDLVSFHTEGRGADCIIVTASTKSNEPVELAGEIARDRARVVIVGLVGMDIPRHSFYAKELELRLSRSYGPGRYDPQYEEKGTDYPVGYVRWTERRNMEAFVRLVSDGKVSTGLLTTHRFLVEQASDAYSLILGQHNERFCGVVLQYPGSEIDSGVKTRQAKAGKTGELGVGFIGAGSFARGVLLPIVKRSAGVKLLGVATATGVSSNNTAEQFGFSYCATDYLKVLDDALTHCVFIATRHDSHARLTAEALARGKAVFVEKPLATSYEGLREVVRAARESNGLLMVGYNRRFSPHARALKRELSNRKGPVTIVYRVNAGGLPADHWALDQTEGGGRVIGEVCHFVDFIQYLTGSLPVRVSAEGVSPGNRAGPTDDSCVISMATADGSIASIAYAASGDKSVAKEKVEVFCDRFVAVIDDFKSTEIIRGGKKNILVKGAQDKGHSGEMEEFFALARSDRAAPISLDALVATSLACLLIVESARDGRTKSIDTAGFLQ